MRRTPFAGLTVLEPGEPFSTDGYSFQDRNPDITDRLLRVGAVTHRHDEHLALENPTIAPSASAVASAGAFPAEVDVRFGYTLVDAWGGESLISDLAEVTTPSKIPAPDAPSGAADYAAGGLLAGTYSYVKTWVDGAGGETEASFERLVTLEPGHASGRVQFTNLASGMAAAGAAGWRLYKSANGSYFRFIASGTANTLDDDGTLCADCTGTPPQSNTTQDRNTLLVEMPASGALPPDAVAFRLYGSLGVGFDSPSFFGQYPLASGGSVFQFTAWNPGDGSPPPISNTLPGAAKIDPATELTTWLPERETVAILASAIVASGQASGFANMAAGYDVFRVQTNYPARVRLYAASGYVAGDAGRSATAAPTGDHGVVLDQLNDTDLDTAVAPNVVGSTFDGGIAVAYIIDSFDSVTRDITVTLHWRRRE